MSGREVGMSEGPSGGGPVHPFAGFDREQLGILRGAGRRVLWRPGGMLMCAGEAADYAVVLESGLVKIVSEAKNGYSTLLAVRGPGELVGELSCLDGGVRSATVVAKNEVVGHVIATDRFQGLLKMHNGLSYAVLLQVISRLRSSDDRRTELGSASSAERIVQVLLERARLHGKPVAGRPGVIEVDATQQELASAASTSRESAVRALGVLSRQELLATASRGRIHLLDLDLLESWRPG
jgi:CRP/FNR family transcriptional regulator, cyclic AMP receptor protein